MLTFVNTIAEIVHSNVHSWGGQCNKNLGNAFVIVWRIGDEATLLEANTASIMSRKNVKNKGRATIADGGASMAPRGSVVPSTRTSDSPTIRSKSAGNRFSAQGSMIDDDDSQSSGGNNAQTVSLGKKNTPGRQTTIDLKRVPGIEEIAEGALIGYLKVIVDINRHQHVLRYRYDKRLNEDAQSLAEPSPSPSPAPSRPASVRARPMSVRNPTSVRGIFEDLKAISEENPNSHSGLRPASVRLVSSRRRSVNFSDSLSAVKDTDVEGQTIADPVKDMLLKAAKDDSEDHHDQFKVRMGFGLHAGWAIEGAVGSLFKVDATYLSPHVNMAARLETSSRQYKVPLLMSHFFQELLSESVQKKCRKVDIVTVKGSEVPIGVFTYDAFQDQFFTDTSEVPAKLTSKSLHRLMSIAQPSPNLPAHINGSPNAPQSPVPTGPGSSRARSPSVEGTPNLKQRKSLLSSFSPIVEDGKAESPSKTETKGSYAKNDVVEYMDNPFRRGSSPDMRRRPSVEGSDPSSSGKLSGSRPGSPSVGPLSPAPSPTPVAAAPVVSTANTLSHRPLPLPPMDTSHSPRVRLMLTQVHRELLRMQKLHEELATQAILEKSAESAASTKDSAAANPRQQANYQNAMEQLRALFPNSELFLPPHDDLPELFIRDVDLLQLQAHLTTRFNELFDEGVKEYLKGNWPVARTFLEQANSLMAESVRTFMRGPLYMETDPIKKMQLEAQFESGNLPALTEEELQTYGDGPSQTLLNYMKNLDYTAPASWQGYRPLTSK